MLAAKEKYLNNRLKPSDLIIFLVCHLPTVLEKTMTSSAPVAIAAFALHLKTLKTWTAVD